jgi:putative transposase
MTAVADTLGVARSNLVARAKRGGSRPRLQYRKAGDAELLARIRPLVDARPSYGYRRITALLNRQAQAEGLARVNHKRVYRVMKRGGLLLAPHTGRGRQRPHDGEVATATSNRRWAADVFEIPYWNGDALRIAFAIDPHGREVLAWTASLRGIGGIAVPDLMQLAVERRFGALRTQHPVEWLADNGSCFTAHETVAFAHAIGLMPCFTPVRSPQSNGIAEAFVKTFKAITSGSAPGPTPPRSWPSSIAGSRTTTRCTRTAPSGCARPASSSGRTNLPPVRSDGATPAPPERPLISMAARCLCDGGTGDQQGAI